MEDIDASSCVEDKAEASFSTPKGRPAFARRSFCFSGSGSNVSRSGGCWLQKHFGAFFPGQPPVAHGGEDGAEGFAFGGQLIGEMFRAVLGRHLGDDAVGLEAGKAVAQDIRGDAFGGSCEIFEAGAAQDEVADDEEGPAVAEDIKATSHRAGGAAFDPG